VLTVTRKGINERNGSNSCTTSSRSGAHPQRAQRVPSMCAARE